MQEIFGHTSKPIADLRHLCRLVNESTGFTSAVTPEKIKNAWDWLLEREQGRLDSLGARYSKYFSHQLTIHNLDNHFSLLHPVFCKLMDGQARPYDTWKILDEVRLLERESLDKGIPLEERPEGLQIHRLPNLPSKPATMFRGETLHGFWHKHHTQAGFIPFNLASYWQSPAGDRHMKRFCKEHYPGDTCTEEERENFFNLLSHEATFGAYQAKMADHYLTGNWIVFAKHEGKNYYLLLATHADKDEHILECISRLRPEFPFLNSYPQFS